MLDVILSWVLRICFYGAIVCAIILTVLYMVRDVLTWFANRRNR